MHQTKKGKQWYFGMKAHIGVDAQSGLTHSLETTPANASDVATAHALLHGGEEQVWGDAGYQGVGKREENRDTDVDWQVAMKPGKRKLLDKAGPEEAAEKRKASVRAKVEHPFLYLFAQRLGHAGASQLVEFVDGGMGQHVGVLSAVVAGATDVVMLDRSGEFDLIGPVVVESVGQDRLDAAVAVGADGQRPCSGRLQAFVAVALR